MIPFLISSFIFLSSFFILLYLRNEPAIKSRRLIPYFGAIAQYLYILFGYFENSQTNEWRIHNRCIWISFFNFGVTNIIISLPYFVLFNYIILINVNKWKQRIYKLQENKIEMTSFSRFFFKIFNLFRGNTFSIVFGAFVYLITVFPIFIALTISKFNCLTLESTFPSTYMSASISVIQICIIIAMLLLDFVLNIRIIFSKHGIYKYYIKTDIYMFRFEYLMTTCIALLFGNSLK
jgi:hypothetical protein